MILASLFTLAGQEQQPAQGGGSFITAIIPFVLVFVIFYLLIILPSRRKQKKHQQMVEELKAGDKIVTTGGIHGTVMGVQQDKIEVKVSANVKIDISKNAVSVIQNKKPDQKK
ncbi:MAG: preprotein translocase subunit YajC [Candidatus Aminicenantes bacterium]|nr:preprotein translocase subunit YajC [Candidatus Aminicenantes bacterium]